MRPKTPKTLTAALALSWAAGWLAGCSGESGATLQMLEIPITTASEPARDAYLEGRALVENFHFAEARPIFRRAVELDPDFALAHLALAQVASSAPDFFADLERAVELADGSSGAGLSPGERLLILAQEAGARRDPVAQHQYLVELVESYPEDARAHFRLGGYYFGRKRYDEAIERYREATRLNPEFTPAYNLMGYAQRILGHLEDAEGSFKRYIELLPDEPNPYDSYAEFLMRIGRFEESIANYSKALELDPSFVFSYVGIGHNQVLQGRPEDARQTFSSLEQAARDDQERRTALLWTTVSYLHEQRYPDAQRSCKKMQGLAEAGGDWAGAAGDLVLMGHILLAEGRSSAAVAAFDQALAIIEQSDVNPEQRAGFRRGHLYRQARAALVAGDRDTARRHTEAFAEAVAEQNLPEDIRQVHELQGLIALDAGDLADARSHLEQADQEDPRVLYRLALATRAAGDLTTARELAARVADWNQLSVGYAFVRREAKKLLSELERAAA